MSLKYLKESRPVELTNYSVANKIDHAPDFSWWVTLNLKKRNRIVSKSQKKYWRTTHKFCIGVAILMKQAYGIDDETGT